MSGNFKQILENVKHLNPQEKALMAHVIISSLDTAVDEEVDLVWGELAEQRFDDLQSGNVQSVTWEEIKKGIKGYFKMAKLLFHPDVSHEIKGSYIWYQEMAEV